MVDGNDLLFSNTSKSNVPFLNSIENHALCIWNSQFKELTIVTNSPEDRIAYHVTRSIDNSLEPTVQTNGQTYNVISERTVFFGNIVSIVGLDGEYEHLYNFFTSFNELNPNTKMIFANDSTINLTRYHAYPPVYMQKLIEAIKSVAKPLSDDDIQVTQEGIQIKKTKA